MRAAVDRSSQPLVLVGNMTDTGRVRDRNEDFLGYFRIGSRRLFAVADGMGGEAGGQEASHLAIATVERVFTESGDAAPGDLLRAAVLAANEACLEAQRERPDLRGMGTTLDLLLMEHDAVWPAHVGDGRMYLVRAGKARPITRDHTRVQQMVDEGLIGAAEAAGHPMRNILSRVLGREQNLEADIGTAPIRLQEGDAIAMCSDGIHDLISHDEIAWVIERYGPHRACKKLVELANARGGGDNSTIQVAFFGSPRSSWSRMNTLLRFPYSMKRQAKSRMALLLSLLIATIAGSAAGWQLLQTLDRALPAGEIPRVFRLNPPAARFAVQDEAGNTLAVIRVERNGVSTVLSVATQQRSVRGVHRRNGVVELRIARSNGSITIDPGARFVEVPWARHVAAIVPAPEATKPEQRTDGGDHADHRP